MAIPLTPMEVSNPELAAILLGTPAPGEELSGDGAGESLPDASAESAPDEPEASTPAAEAAANDADLIADILSLLDEYEQPLTAADIAFDLSVRNIDRVEFIVHNVLHDQVIIHPANKSKDSPARYSRKKSTPAAEFATLVSESNRLAANKIRDRILAGAPPDWHARLLVYRANHPGVYQQLGPANYGHENFRRSHLNQTIWNGPRAFLDKDFASFSQVVHKNADGNLTVEYRFSLRPSPTQTYTGSGKTVRAAYLDALRQQRLAAYDVKFLVRKVDRQSRTILAQVNRIMELRAKNIEQSRVIADYSAATAENGDALTKLRTRRDNWRSKYERREETLTLEIGRRERAEERIEGLHTVIANLKSEIAEMRAAALGVSVEQLPGLTTDHADIIEPAAAIS